MAVGPYLFGFGGDHSQMARLSGKSRNPVRPSLSSPGGDSKAVGTHLFGFGGDHSQKTRLSGKSRNPDGLFWIDVLR